jgi:hypothetical protein
LAVVRESIVDVVLEILVLLVVLCCFPQILKSGAVVVSSNDGPDLNWGCLEIVEVLFCQ